MTQVNSKETIVLIEISDIGGNIKPEFLASYNRELTDADIEKMIELYQNNARQQIIDDYNVRKITGSSHLINQIVHIVVGASDLGLFKFIFGKLSYDDKARSLFTLDTVEPSIREHIQQCVDEFGLDYSEEFDMMRQRCGLVSC